MNGKRRAMQGIFFLGGLALVIAGLNGSRPLVVVGVGMMVLAVVSRFFANENA